MAAPWPFMTTTTRSSYPTAYKGCRRESLPHRVPKAQSSPTFSLLDKLSQCLAHRLVTISSITASSVLRAKSLPLHSTATTSLPPSSLSGTRKTKLYAIPLLSSAYIYSVILSIDHYPYLSGCSRTMMPTLKRLSPWRQLVFKRPGVTRV